MLFVLQAGVAVYAKGQLPAPPPDQRVALLGQALSVAERFPLDLSSALFRHGLSLAPKLRHHRARSPKASQQLAGETTALFREMNLEPMLAGLIHLPELLEEAGRDRVGWWVTTNLATLYHWRTFFPAILRIAKDADERDARAALQQAILVEKTVIYLPWVRDRFDRARAANDQRFFSLIGRALSAPPVPLLAKKGAVDLFLSIFDCWLNEMPLSEQVSLLREGGLAVTTNGLRNRRSRLGLGSLDRDNIPELSPDVRRMIAEQRARGSPMFQNG
jgi:hypothetical protein